uniref:Ig-like domain-containing protein n=1 Tax=Nothobranchius kuhntae TaxID=321403 RepID=A0A1A8JJM6_NOTKU
MLLLAAVFCVVVASVTTETIYKKLGDDVDLKPEVPLVGKISGITWKIGRDIAAQWDGAELDYFVQFKVRGHLDNATGVMTIRGLEKGDGNIYTAEVNHNLWGKPIRLIVISEVPVPSVREKCSEEPRACTLTCEGNVTEAEPVTYTWRSDQKVELGVGERTLTITEESSATEAFTCEVKNPVSQKSSEPFTNPFSSSHNTAPKEGLKIVTGLVVFFCLLTVALLPVIVHRIRTGVCFYEKMSMPWEKDFWTREQADAVDSNGTATHSPYEKSDEEAPMTGS